MKDYTNSSQSVQAWRNVPIIDEVVALPSPPPIEAEPAPQNIQVGLIIVVSANLAVMAVIIIGMIVDGAQAGIAIITGVAYFTLTSPLYLAIVTGVLTAIMGRREREKTERLRIQAYKELGEQAIAWRQSVEQNRHLELTQQALPRDIQRRLAQLESDALERETAQTPGRGSTYISAYSNVSEAAHSDIAPQVDTTAQEAVAWLSGLYDEFGNADRSKLQSDGRLKIRMLGSSRGPGSRDAGLWLISKGVIRKVPGGFALNLRRYPTRESVRNLL